MAISNKYIMYIALFLAMFACNEEKKIEKDKIYSKQEINQMLSLKGKEYTIKILFNNIKREKNTTDIWYSTNVFDTTSFAKRNLMISLCSNDMKNMFWIWCINNDIKIEKETEALLLYKNEIVSDYYNPEPEKTNFNFIRNDNNKIDDLYEFYKEHIINGNEKSLPKYYKWKIIDGFPHRSP